MLGNQSQPCVCIPRLAHFIPRVPRFRAGILV